VPPSVAQAAVDSRPRRAVPTLRQARAGPLHSQLSRDSSHHPREYYTKRAMGNRSVSWVIAQASEVTCAGPKSEDGACAGRDAGYPTLLVQAGVQAAMGAVSN
jgi:hypothetical protein